VESEGDHSSLAGAAVCVQDRQLVRRNGSKHSQAASLLGDLLYSTLGVYHNTQDVVTRVTTLVSLAADTR
jgi:hypothetical protein